MQFLVGCHGSSYNSSFLGGRDREASPGKMSLRPHLNMRWVLPVIPATWGSTNKRIVVQAFQGIKWDLDWKNNNSKRAEGMVRVVACLPDESVVLEFNLYRREVGWLCFLARSWSRIRPGSYLLEASPSTTGQDI
jgi:hypothetical protein